ncbi:hypothetical protein [Desulfosarcina cetonica]|uniref:hypothetical protein n=1 Tax=Desulfosarcina cetonica TaxID=90730 RepID=UPI0012EDFF83|nr:hypothetical protein [Desulfosarcina cetonica]
MTDSGRSISILERPFVPAIIGGALMLLIGGCVHSKPALQPAPLTAPLVQASTIVAEDYTVAPVMCWKSVCGKIQHSRVRSSSFLTGPSHFP